MFNRVHIPNRRKSCAASVVSHYTCCARVCSAWLHPCCLPAPPPPAPTSPKWVKKINRPSPCASQRFATALPDVLDDFGSNEDNWELTYDSDGSIYYKAGQLRVAVEATETLLWTQGAYDSTNYYLELDVEHHEGALDNQIGVIFRFIDSDNYYLYSISSDGYYSLFQLRDDEWETVLDWTSSKLIETGAGSVNTLGILAEDATVTLIVNDYILDQATMPTTDGMGIGLAAGAFDEPPIDVGYDELRLWQLNPTDSGPPPIRIPGRVTPDSEAIPTGEPTEEPVEEATPTPAPTEEPVEEATPTPVATEEPVEEATPTPVATEEPVEEATPTLVATEEPVEEATPTPVATEEPVEEVTPTPTPAPIDEPGLGYANSIPVDDPVIAAIQAGAPTYIEEFEQALTDWSPYATTGITYDVVDGALQIDIASPSSLGWSGLPSYPTSYYLEVDIATAETFPEAESGILYNYQSAQDFDFFAINNTGSYSHWRLRNNQWEEVVGWTEGDMLNTGPDNVNRLGLLVQDGQTTLVANGEVLDVIEEAQPLSGALALAAGTFTEGGLIVRFDNLALWDLVQGLPVEPIATPVPPATAADRIAEIQATEADFSDDFRRDTGAWETDVDDYSSSFYERRALHVEVTGPNRSAWATFVDAAGYTRKSNGFLYRIRCRLRDPRRRQCHRPDLSHGRRDELLHAFSQRERLSQLGQADRR